MKRIVVGHNRSSSGDIYSPVDMELRARRAALEPLSYPYASRRGTQHPESAL
jgi:hypothetical protein